MNDHENDHAAIDLWDFLFLCAGAAFPPLFLVAVAQWAIRRNANAMTFVSERVALLMAPVQTLIPAMAAADGPQTEPSPHALPADNLVGAPPDLIVTLANLVHVLLVGHTRGGKTTLLHNLAAHLSVDAAVLVIDPDSIEGTYPGYRVVGAGDNYNAIGHALTLVGRQLDLRRKQRSAGKRSFDPAWILVDEAHDVFSFVEGSRDLVIDLVKRGAKLNMHVVVGTQDAQVKTLGLEGRSQTLINLTRVDVQVKDGTRVATINEQEIPVPALALPDDMVSLKPVQPGAGKTAHDSQQTTLLASLLASSFPQSHHESAPEPQANQSGNADHDATAERDQTIRDMYAAGVSKNKIWEWLKESHGIAGKVRAYDVINAALAANDEVQPTIKLAA